MYQFAVGDHVVTTGSGLGVIIDIEARYTTEFYVIKNEFGTVLKPVTTKDQSLRNPESYGMVQQALLALEKKSNPLPNMGHRQERHIGSIIMTNNFAQMVALLRQLYVPTDQERSTLRMEHYEQLLTIVASEVAHVLALPRLGMRGMIEASIIARKLVPELRGPS